MKPPFGEYMAVQKEIDEVILGKEDYPLRIAGGFSFSGIAIILLATYKYVKKLAYQPCTGLLAIRKRVS